MAITFYIFKVYLLEQKISHEITYSLLSMNYCNESYMPVVLKVLPGEAESFGQASTVFGTSETG